MPATGETTPDTLRQHPATRFSPSSDREFYCYLKAHLPPPYTVLSEPSRAYYSEWQFDYRIFRGDELIREFKGDFREIEAGELLRAAREIMSMVRAEHADW